MTTRASSDEQPESENVVALRKSFETPVARKAAKTKEDKKKSGGEPPPPKPPPPGYPERLPPNAPVKALGTLGGDYFYIDHLGQLRVLKAKDHGRTQIYDLFGGAEYLNATWPVWESTAAGWIQKDDFKHGKLAPVMMATCGEIGIWDPADKVRGCGSWVEDTGALVMHTGNKLWRAIGGSIIPEEAGTSGALLYPRRPTLPEPDFKHTEEAGPRIMDMLETWNWQRRDIDPMLALGWNVIALIGQAAPWRPVLWVNGAKGTGKSTLARFFEWLHSRPALVMPTNTTQAFVYQKLGDSSLPVLLDEFESKDENNKRMEDVIELMRIAASGGELGRGGSDNNPKTHVLKSSFAAFSINMPPLEPQDISRMAVLVLKKLERRAAMAEFDLAAPAEHDLILGSRDRWAKTGKQLRGRVLQQWPRFLQTFNAYHHALLEQGHDGRGAFQFGALGAGYDIAMHDALKIENARAWAALLPAADLAETKGYVDEPQACLQHLLAHSHDLVRHGTRETVGYYLRTARSDLEQDKRNNDSDDASRILAKMGMRVYRDAERVNIVEGVAKPIWWVAVSSTHPGLIEIFKGTKWRGRSGTPGAWVRALRGLDGVIGKARDIRIDGQKNWVTEILWDCVFPPFGASSDSDEIETVDARDRNKMKGEN